MVFEPSQQLVETCRDQFLINPESSIIQQNLLPCDHKEADSRIVLHAYQVECILAFNLDSLQFCFSFNSCSCCKCHNKHLWVYFGVVDSHKVLGAVILKTAIAYKNAIALQVFHTFTGCDTVPLLKSIGKKTAWKWWRPFDNVTAAILDLSSGNTTVRNETAGLLKRFAILLYNKTSMNTSVNQLRKGLFTLGCSIEKVPPMSGALLQHDNRTLHQGGNVWVNAHIKEINITDLVPGWTKGKIGKNALVCTLDAPGSEAYCQLVKLMCKNKDGVCSSLGRCSCKEITQKCTELRY